MPFIALALSISSYHRAVTSMYMYGFLSIKFPLAFLIFCKDFVFALVKYSSV